MVFFISTVSFLTNNLTDFLIVQSLINGYMLIASTYAIVSSSLFIFSSLSLSFRSDAWMMETRGYFTFKFLAIYLI